MEEGQRTESVDQLTAAVRLRPRSGEAENALGEAYNKFGDTAGARTAFEKAVALQPDYAVAQLNLGQSLLAAGEFTAAADPPGSCNPFVWPGGRRGGCPLSAGESVHGGRSTKAGRWPT